MSQVFVRFRYWVSKLVYEIIFTLLVRDGSWQESLLISLSPKTGERILNFGDGSSLSAVSFAIRYPDTAFVGVDPNVRAVEKARRKILRKKLRNVSVVSVPRQGKLDFEVSSFDKAVCILGLHDRQPEQKLHIIEEITKVMLRNGTLHVADLDKPNNRGESRILELARRISGSAAVEPHINGTWTELLAKGRLAGVRRQSSHSVGIGRITIVKARKR